MDFFNPCFCVTNDEFAVQNLLISYQSKMYKKSVRPERDTMTLGTWNLHDDSHNIIHNVQREWTPQDGKLDGFMIKAQNSPNLVAQSRI